MFYEIFRFEIKRAFQRPAIYIYWGLMFLLSFFIMNAAGGAFKSISIGIGGNVFINSPGLIDLLMGAYSYLSIFIVAAICSNIIFKDYSNNSLELIYSTPIKKYQYIFGRFLAAYTISIIVLSGIALGLFTGTIMPYLNPDLFGPNELKTYVFPYLTRILPNTLLVCSIFFSVSLLLRNVTVNWISIIVLYILYAISMNLFKDLDNQTIASILDPFGIAASLKVTTSNSASDMNEKGAQLVDIFLYNRLFWMGIAAITLVFTYYRFKFAYNLSTIKLIKRKQKKQFADTDAQEIKTIDKPKTLNLSNNSNCKFFKLLKFELRKLFKNPYFLLISLIIVIFLFVTSKAVGKIYDTTTYPVTYQVISILGGSIQLFLFIIIMIFSGEMIWRDRDNKIFEISQTYPVARWNYYLSKFVSLNIAIIVLLLTFVGCGIIAQSIAGYYNFEIGLYFKYVFGIFYVEYFLTCVLAFFFHILINNKYLSYVALIFYWIIDNYFIYKILKHHLLVYGGGPSVMYSDMDKFGFELIPYYSFKLWWVLIAVILMIISNQLMVSQTEDNFRLRLKLLRSRTQRYAKNGLFVLLPITLMYGGFLFYKTNIKNDFTTSYKLEKLIVDYEKTYKHFENTPQPKITDVSLNVDLYPSKGDVMANGTYKIENKTNQPIDTILINAVSEIKNIEFNRTAVLIKHDKKQDIYLYKLTDKLLPGEIISMTFDYEGKNTGFDHNGAQNYCRKNGTFLYNSEFPGLGYQSNLELYTKKSRQKHNLPEKDIARKINDPKGIETNFISNDADFINYELIVSTSSDQTAVSPGKLIDQWTENNRNYFHYQSEKPMINYYAILSARYQILSDKWFPENNSDNPVDISIMYHKGHEYNLENMMKGVKLALSTYSGLYSPYQYQQLRIVEFPLYSNYAQSFPNMIPFSEGIGFIADLRELNDSTKSFDKQKIDYPFFVTTHEMAHQWFAHQVIAADVEGAQMLMESITQFSALQCMELYYGEDKMKKFFQNEMFSYLSSRKNEIENERPLALVAPHQQSIYYNKGALVMNSLANYLGKEKFLSVVKSFIGRYAFKEAPYPTTANFISSLKQETPDSLIYFIEDQLEKITFYESKVHSISYKRNKDFTYQFNAEIELEKFYADGKGKESSVACNDFIEIGIYNHKNEIIYLEKVRLHDGKNSLNLSLKRKPSYMIIDPCYNLMFKNYERPMIDIEKM